MEGQAAVAAPAEAPASTPAPTNNEEVPDIGTLSESEYGHQRSVYEKTNGPGSWLKRAHDAQGARAKPATEAKPAAAKADAATPSDDLIDGEISIDESGTARDKRTGQFVPKSAFLRVKGEVGELRGKHETLTGELIRARERLSIFDEATRPKAEPKVEAKPIDPKEDVFGAVEFMANKIKELESKLDGNAKTTEQAITEQRNKDAFTSDIRAFAQKEPAFVEAFGFLRDQYDKELQAIGVDSKDERDAQINRDLKEFVTGTIGNKKSPAELLYKRALARGYQAKAAVAAETEAQKAAREEIERINSGQAASASLRGAGTGAVAEQITRDKVASMSEGEYYTTRASYIAKHGRAAWDKIVL